jgi:methylenetetrahydrofolate reductase (NADPH)
MRIGDLLQTGGPVFSFEFFPPKTEVGEQNLFRTIERLGELHPSFVSVTYGAGGSTRQKTVELVRRIKHDLGIEAMAHLTCVGAGRHEIESVLEQLAANGIENLLALRGDPPADQPLFVQPADGFRFASELVRFIRGRGCPPFSLGGACYPEGHIECRDLALDLAHLKIKVDAGVDFLITQLFFDTADYFALVARARARGITVPIIPGIMPVTNVAQIERFTLMCGARIPAPLHDRLHAAPNDEAVRAIGIDHATTQCRELLAGGAPGIHFYTLNQSPATRAVFERLKG